jgi:fructokinase
LIDFELIKQETGRVTNKPDETINKIVETIVNNLGQSKKIDFVGISSFGPLELHRDNQNYGSITSTPK